MHTIDKNSLLMSKRLSLYDIAPGDFPDRLTVDLVSIFLLSIKGFLVSRLSALKNMSDSSLLQCALKLGIEIVPFLLARPTLCEVETQQRHCVDDPS